jgi:rhamnulokinase
MEPTFHYRDPRTKRGVERTRSLVDWPTIFAETGIQFMPLNTIFQLGAENPKRLKGAARLLLIGDGFNYLLSGVARAEVSLASTTQLYNPVARAWSAKLLGALGLPARIFPEIVPSGTRLGPVQPDLVKEAGLLTRQKTGLPDTEVVASCSHDTGAAVVAVPASGQNWAYISSGTWSLMGVELAQPVITDACRRFNFTNEIGYGNSVRLLKNIVGLWIVQECRREWAAQGQEYDYSVMTHMAADAEPFVSLINPADPRFLSPGNMPAKIADFCRETDQPIPMKPGAMLRCVLESLALLYRRTLLELEQLVGYKIERLHIVGGGSQNTLLNHFTANALQIPVLTGPVEATALGNVLVQAMALGHVPSLDAARQIVRNSSKIETVHAANAEGWRAAWDRFVMLLARTEAAK